MKAYYLYHNQRNHTDGSKQIVTLGRFNAEKLKFIGHKIIEVEYELNKRKKKENEEWDIGFGFDNQNTTLNLILYLLLNLKILFFYYTDDNGH